MTANLLFPFKMISKRVHWISMTVLSMLFLMAAENVTAAPRCESVFERSQAEQLISDFSKGSKDFFLAVHLAKKILTESPSEQALSINAIGQIYRLVPKKDPNPLAAWHIGGRRLLDYTLALVQRQDLQFAQGHALGKSGKELYQNFFQGQKALFATKYEAKDVIQYAEFLQQQIRVLQPQFQGPPLKIILGGSFINGKANLKTSDLDISVNQPKLIQEKASWELVFNKLLRQENPETTMTLEMHGEPAAFYGKINPIVLVISANKIVIQVFEPAQISSRSSELEVRNFKEYLL